MMISKAGTRIWEFYFYFWGHSTTRSSGVLMVMVMMVIDHDDLAIITAHGKRRDSRESGQQVSVMGRMKQASVSLSHCACSMAERAEREFAAQDLPRFTPPAFTAVGGGDA
jgi:hypothetical protein